MSKEYIEDLVYGARLLVSVDADKTELNENIRCARTLLESFPDMSIVIRRNVFEFQFKNPEYLINGEIGDRKGIHNPNQIAKHLLWRPDFSEAAIHLCYVVYRGRAVEVRSDMRTREEIAMVLEKLKAER